MAEERSKPEASAKPSGAQKRALDRRLRPLVRSSVDFSAMASAENQNQELFVFNLADEAVISYAVFPELPEFGAMQGLTDAARVVQWGKEFVKELENTLAVRRVPLAQIAVDLGGEFNLPGHAASAHLPAGWSARRRCECVLELVRRDRCPRGRRGDRG